MSRRLLESGIVIFDFDLKPGCSLNFKRKYDDNWRHDQAYLIVPKNYSSLVEEDNTRQTVSMVIAANMCRDYYSGRLDDGDSATGKRGWAFAADALNTLKTQAKLTGTPFRISEDHSTVLLEYPHGLVSLGRRFRYETPSFRSRLH